MQSILVMVHLFLSIGLIGLILIQHGKGADAGAAFGSGASGTVFGARGSANFLSRATGILALAFFVTSLTLAWLAMESAKDAGLMVDAVEAEAIPAPVTETDLPPIAAQPAAGSDLPDVPVVEKTGDAEVPTAEGAPEKK